jgi:hypothetical protein
MRTGSWRLEDPATALRALVFYKRCLDSDSIRPERWTRMKQATSLAVVPHKTIGRHGELRGLESRGRSDQFEGRFRANVPHLARSSI